MLFDFAPLIVERLRTECPSVRLVASYDDIADLDAAKQVTPALAVIYQGYRPAEEFDDDGEVVAVQSDWLVVVCVANARQGGVGLSRTGDRKEDANPICAEVLRAMMGWIPGDDGAPVRLAGAPQPFYDAAAIFVPLGFSLRQTIDTRE